MGKSKFTDAQIVAMVRESEAEGVTVEQVAKKHGVNAADPVRVAQAVRRVGSQPGR